MVLSVLVLPLVSSVVSLPTFVTVPAFLTVPVSVVVVVLFVLPDATDAKTVVVPNCENLKVSACEKKLHKLGFEVQTDIEIVESATIEKNKVVKTKPEAGRNVKQGTKIVIYKSIQKDEYISP